jgi:predicted nucleic acid-binding protein
MNYLVDANIYLAVIMNEPEKAGIIRLTENSDLVSPEILPYEIGNAFSAMAKRGSIEKKQVEICYAIFKKIPVRLASVEIGKALQIAVEYNIYAYDAYYLETAKRLNLPILTLDKKMKDIANKMKIFTPEVE